GIEAAAGIAVPVPCAAEIGGRFKHGGVDAEIDQPLDLVDAGHAGADDNDLVMGFGVPHQSGSSVTRSLITDPFAHASNRGMGISATGFALRRCLNYTGRATSWEGSMRIAVVGAGGVGGGFGAALAKAGANVTFIARGAHLAAMKSEGLRVNSPRGDTHLVP